MGGCVMERLGRVMTSACILMEYLKSNGRFAAYFISDAA